MLKWGKVLTKEDSNSRGDLCSSSGEFWAEDGNMTKVLKEGGMEGEDKASVSPCTNLGER